MYFLVLIDESLFLSIKGRMMYLKGNYSLLVTFFVCVTVVFLIQSLNTQLVVFL